MVREGGETGFFCMLDGDGGHPGGRIILWWRRRKTTAGEEGYRMAGGEGGAVPIITLHNNRRRSLGLEWSMCEVGTPPPHNLGETHGLVASNNNNIARALTANNSSIRKSYRAIPRDPH